MTSHRLIYCDLPTLLSAVAMADEWVEVHRHQRGHRAWARWRGTQLWSLTWTLHAERGANGVLAHLTAEPTRGSWGRLRLDPVQATLHPLAAFKLAELARRAERASHQHSGSDIGDRGIESEDQWWPQH
jgi:hypothetical protein